MAEAKVGDLLEFIGYQLTREEAIQLLKVSLFLVLVLFAVVNTSQINDNSVEAAASKFWDTDPSNLKKLLIDSVPRWDETAFAAGRYGQDDPIGAVPSMWTFTRTTHDGQG